MESVMSCFMESFFMLDFECFSISVVMMFIFVRG